MIEQLSKPKAKKPVAKLPRTPLKKVVTKEPPKIVDVKSARFKKKMERTGAITGTHAQRVQNDKPCYSTGCLFLDLAIGSVDPRGNIGIPERSFVEIFGPNHVLKSGTLTQIIISVQKQGKYAVVLYTEEPDLDRLEAEGVDLSLLIVLPGYEPAGREARFMLAEHMLATLVDWSKEEDVALIAIDSLKGLTTEGQIYKKADGRGAEDRSMSQTETAARANAMEKFFNRLKVHNKKAILVIVNQLNESPNVSFTTGSNDRPQTSGGRRKEFECTLRIEVVSKVLAFKDEHAVVEKYKPGYGLNVFYKLVKNRRSKGMGFKRANAEYIFAENGFNNAKTALTLGQYIGIIPRNGNHYVINDISYNGKNQAIDALRDKKTYNKYKRLLIEKRVEIFNLRESDKKLKASEMFKRSSDGEDEDSAAD